MEQQLYDIYPMVHIPFWQTDIFLIFVISIVIVICMFFCWFTWRKIRSRPIVITPWEQALQSLTSLQKNYLENNDAFISTESSKQFYVSLVLLHKTYLMNRYGFAVMGKTDAELFAYLKETEYPQELCNFLETIYMQSTMTRFASDIGSRNQMERDIKMSQEIITLTIPSLTKKNKK